MDYARSGYECFMKTWQDKPDLVRVKWFRADEDAKIFPYPHLFGSQKTWDRTAQNPPEYPGESGYVAWSNSANPLLYAGLGHCGSDNAMSLGGITGVDPPIVTAADGSAPCCPPMLICDDYPIPGGSLHMRSDLISGACICLDGFDLTLPYVGQHVFAPGWHLWSSAIHATNVCSDGVGGNRYAFGLDVAVAGRTFGVCPAPRVQFRLYQETAPGLGDWVLLGVPNYGFSTVYSFDPFQVDYVGGYPPIPANFGPLVFGSPPLSPTGCWLLVGDPGEIRFRFTPGP